MANSSSLPTSTSGRVEGPDGNLLAARNTFSGTFTYSPIGPLKPNGEHIEWELINTFRYDDDGRLAEEWVQTDYRSFSAKLAVTMAPQSLATT
jgi:predicted ester cyclase